jgi:hypothetical protein
MSSAVHSANRAPTPSGLADVLDLLTLDARIVIASVDTYLALQRRQSPRPPAAGAGNGPARVGRRRNRERS